MSVDLQLPQPQKSIDQILNFLKENFAQAHKKNGIVAVSGGIDSALSLTLLCEAIGPKNVWPLFLPYKDQSISDSQAIAALNRIPKSHWRTIQIEPIIHGLETTIEVVTQNQLDNLRRGNAMARARMMVVYDAAKELDALVCGTENKSEKYLAYFTRFGDEASDIEPIQHLYKTQVRQLVKHLNLPEQFLTKAPSAGLWSGQTDEQELGFRYEQADQVIELYLQKAGQPENMTQLLALDIAEQTTIDLQTVEAILQRVQSQDFKHHVPYTIDSH